MRVFLAEDDAAMREHLGQVLRAIPRMEIVFAAATEEEAIGWLDAHPKDWDLALIDLFLERGNGFNILRRCAVRSSQQRVVLMSNYARDPVRERAAETGADAFFDKTTEITPLIDFCIEASRSLHPDAGRKEAHRR
ncbi:DNA-binding NarL/FixJ family response regulator [Variovorax paradoxus]|uniref:response regulator n=1 Tax=Variovorax paradoxus TaxID=34073 RepID=UPI00278DDABB|nr:response regulator transcription factor [Variovorax paradoxus]MDQ0572145.1 DNA-binding NarL/FixJ family response regulator [Variovorax paradoxus]